MLRDLVDITRVPPYGAFTCIYKERRDLKDQRFGLTSIQGSFIGIAYHKKTLDYCITDGTRVSCTRHHIAFDPYLYPFKLNATTPPAWQTFHNLTTPKQAIKDFSGAQTTPDLIHTEELPDNSDESDFDPEQPAPISVPPVEPDDIQSVADTASDSDEESIVPAPTEPPLPTSRSTRVRRAPVTFKPQARQSSTVRPVQPRRKLPHHTRRSCQHQSPQVLPRPRNLHRHYHLVLPHHGYLPHALRRR